MTSGPSRTYEGSLLWTLEEISRLVSHCGNPAETLDNVVSLIQQRFGTDVCSVYLLESDRSTLVLAATIGLRAESVGRVRMRLDEGLVGLVGEQLKPLVVEEATQHPRFKEIFQDSQCEPPRPRSLRQTLQRQTARRCPAPPARRPRSPRGGLRSCCPCVRWSPATVQ